MKMTKKDFLKTPIHSYGKGRRRKLAIFWDWKTDWEHNINGCSHSIATERGCPKKDFMDYAYRVLVLGELRQRVIRANDGMVYYVEHRIANNDAERFKVPLAL